MLSRVTAERFHSSVTSGRTKPCIMGCVQQDGAEVELYVKLSGPEMTTRSHLTEAITAMLAADLDLPVPEPFLVDIQAEFAITIQDPDTRARAHRAIGWNFGSKKLPAGYSTIPTGKPIHSDLVQDAAEILAFDTFICNPDRSAANPNCLTNGRELAIYDHELALRMDGIIDWTPPWTAGAITFKEGLPLRQRHVFQEQLRGVPVDFDRLIGAFEAVTPGRLEEYRATLPPEWVGDEKDLDTMLDYVRELRQNIRLSIANLKGALQ